MTHGIVAISDNQKFLDAIVSLASNKDVDPAKFSAMLDIQERILKKQAETDFNQAFARMAVKIPRIKKDGKVEYLENKNQKDGPKVEAFKFATYENIDAIVRPLLQEEGFSISFTSSSKEGGGIIVTATLMHVGGHSKNASIPVALDTSGGKNNIQGMGSSFSYGKRYAVYMLLNLVAEGEDDDGTRGGMVFIGDAYIANINKLLEETKSDRQVFLRDFMGVIEVENILANQYDRAINALLAKKKKMAGTA